MDDFTAVATDISRQIEEKQRSLQAAIEAEQRRIDALRDLLQRISASGDAFDAEDRKAVLAAIGVRDAALQQLQRESKRQDEVRRQKEAILLQLHTVLSSRTRLLDQVDEESSVLKDHAELLGFFAQKQLQLTDMLKRRMRELVAAVPEGPGRP
jgi:hypothetical protein